MSHEAWFKRLVQACSELRQTCRRECCGIGYCDAVFKAVEKKSKKSSLQT